MTIAEPTPDGDDACVLRMRSDSLRWTGELLPSLGCAFTITSPTELRAEVVAALLMDCA